MPSLSDEIKNAFVPQGELGRLRLEASRTLNREETKLYRKATEEFDAQRRYVRRSFELEYSARVSEERTRLINEAGAVKRSLVPRFLGTDGFNKDAINRQAQINVRALKKRDLDQIDQREAESIRSMLEASHARASQREKPTRDFQKAVDRRSDPERRVRTWSR
jgi:hypothetical protein